MKVDAVVLAGGEGAVIDPTVHVKGLVPIAGRPMVEWVVDALRASESIGEIALVIPSIDGLGSWVEKVDHVVISDASFIENAIAGCDVFMNKGHVVGTTGDLPALTPEAINDYIGRSLATGAEITYPLVRAEDMEAQFPGSQRTYVKVAGGRVTGGNMMVIGPDVVRRNRQIVQALFDTRKSPVAMARVLGISFIFKYITGRLRVDDVENKMGQLLGGECAAVYTEHASIGADVDKPIDVVVAERVLYRRTTGAGPSS